YERIDEIRKKKYSGFMTGYRQLDDVLAGMWKQEFVILGGLPFSGKTTLGLGFLWNMAPMIKTGVISAEMGRDALYFKLFGWDGAISAKRLRNGSL
ncbi:unnamed protein product, partial [marine sediment metagenome]